MYTPNDGERYNPNDPDQAYCLRKAKCYVDRTVDPPVIRVINDRDNYQIVGWVWLTTWGELKVDGVTVSSEAKYFVYNNKKFPPGVYYLVRKGGREFLVSEKTLRSHL